MGMVKKYVIKLVVSGPLQAVRNQTVSTSFSAQQWKKNRIKLNYVRVF
jgi:hypothetical protein